MILLAGISHAATHGQTYKIQAQHEYIYVATTRDAASPCKQLTRRHKHGIPYNQSCTHDDATAHVASKIQEQRHTLPNSHTQDRIQSQHDPDQTA